MPDPDRFVVLGLARARLGWFGEVARWTTSGMLAIDFVKALSPADARARLRSGRRFSAVLVDGGLAGVDRDLFDLAGRSGACTVVVDDGRRDWVSLGATVVLPVDFGANDLRLELDRHAAAIPRATHLPGASGDQEHGSSAGFRGPLVAVTGPGGSGTSTVATSLAQGLASHVTHTDTTVLVDLCRNAELGMLHDAGDVFPGVAELVEAHRLGQLGPGQIRSLTFDVPRRRYRLLLGLRQHRDWTALRARALDEALDALRRTFTAVVADVDDDLEGELATGSVDIEDRNRLTTAAIRSADVVVVTGQAGVKGLHSHLRVMRAVLDHGVEADRIVPVLNRVPRGRGARAETVRAHIALRAGTAVGVLAPVLLGDRSEVDRSARDGHPLPASLVAPVTAVVLARMSDVAPRPAMRSSAPTPVGVGSLATGDDHP